VREKQLQTVEIKSAHPCETRLSDLLVEQITFIWKDWPKNMDISQLDEEGFVLRGQCPHCFHLAAFPSVTPFFRETQANKDFRVVAAARCEACRKFILGIIKIVVTPGRMLNQYVSFRELEAYYPLRTPAHYDANEVPDPVRLDFSEALRCHWVKAWKATVLMCRRSLQTSCDMEKATGNDLFKQIDALAQSQRITEPLKKMAHRIRLLGKKGAHGDYSDIDDTITEKDADDAITFMRHYLEHVYVLPAKLDPGPAKYE
jgi:hypothetical protein